MKKVFIIICTLFFCVSGAENSFSQDYKTSIGLRGGWTSGITAKHFFSESRAIEGIFSSGWRDKWSGYQITGLYEIHKAAFTKDDAEGFFWFYGAGAHFATGYRVEYWHETGKYTGYYDHYSYSTIGIDGIFGLEYKIADLPITLGVDLKPFFEIPTMRGPALGFWDAAFSIRYVIK